MKHMELMNEMLGLPCCDNLYFWRLFQLDIPAP